MMSGWLKALGRVFKAVCLGFWHLARRGRLADVRAGIGGLGRAILSGDIELGRKRTLSCGFCPMFYEPLETCGKPGHVENGEPVGCWCAVTIANRDPRKDCWGRAHGLDVGWADNLRLPAEP